MIPPRAKPKDLVKGFLWWKCKAAEHRTYPQMTQRPPASATSILFFRLRHSMTRSIRQRLQR